MSARDDYAKLDHETFGPHHQGQTSRQGQAPLDEIDALRVRVVQLETQLAAERQQHTDDAVKILERLTQRELELLDAKADAAIGAWVRANKPDRTFLTAYGWTTYPATAYRADALAAGSSLTPEEPT